MFYHVLAYNKVTKLALAVESVICKETDVIAFNKDGFIPAPAVVLFSYQPLVPDNSYSFIEKRFFAHDEYVVGELDYSKGVL